MKTPTDNRRPPPKRSEPKKAPRLRVVKLEGRIAPRLAGNHSETLARDSAKVRPAAAELRKAGGLRVVKLEARITPGIDGCNHNETLARDRA